MEGREEKEVKREKIRDRERLREEGKEERDNKERKVKGREQYGSWRDLGNKKMEEGNERGRSEIRKRG